jgi:hypothetical protein
LTACAAAWLSLVYPTGMIGDAVRRDPTTRAASFFHLGGEILAQAAGKPCGLTLRGLPTP